MSKILIEAAVERNSRSVQKEVPVMKPVLETKTVLEDVPDLVLISPATYAAMYGAGGFDATAVPLKRKLESGAFVVVSAYIPVGEVHVMRGSTLVEKLGV